MRNKDQVYKRPIDKIPGFEFNEDVVSVFDDMISRSVPFYDEIHRILLDVIDRTFTGEGLVYDLGCSTGTTISLIDQHVKLQNKSNSTQKIQPRYVGIDNSKPMLKKCLEKLKSNNVENVELKCQDLQDTKFKKSKLVIMNYTLQFIPIEEREELLGKIYHSLEIGGAFLLAEKLHSPNADIENFITDLYYDFKRRNGYSELEISQKREALENVLIPLTPKNHMEMLNKAGFSKVEMIFRWYNFACYLGIK
ncbi:MAG: carboxy-S-adenosyl-L-methionine synthase CmoA [Bacteriovoracaceae bacterium]|jgi:tRNA (cmo5U34)-methyltransferase|nr:carboxy-S-adenosyl-L-methionine synthase CmoA [Bacteriovoracaceae bacterium]